MLENSLIQWLTFIVLFLTLLAIIWYTIETSKLRKTNQNLLENNQSQLDLLKQKYEIEVQSIRNSIMPQFVNTNYSHSTYECNIEFENIGEQAIDVKSEILTPKTISLTDNRTKSIGKNGKLNVKIQRILSDEERKRLEGRMSPEMVWSGNFELRILFKDKENHPYIQNFSFNYIKRDITPPVSL